MTVLGWALHPDVSDILAACLYLSIVQTLLLVMLRMLLVTGLLWHFYGITWLQNDHTKAVVRHQFDPYTILYFKLCTVSVNSTKEQISGEEEHVIPIGQGRILKMEHPIICKLYSTVLSA